MAMNVPPADTLGAATRDACENGGSLQARPLAAPPTHTPWGDYLRAAACVGAATAIAGGMFQYFAPANLIMVYLFGVVIVAQRLGRRPAIFATCISVIFFDFLFVPPHFGFSVHDGQYGVTFVVMLVIGTLISELTARVKQQAEDARQRERRTAALYELGRKLTTSYSERELIRSASEHLARVFDMPAAVLLPDAKGVVSTGTADALEDSAAQCVFDHGTLGGAGTGTMPDARGIYLPVKTAQRVVAVIRLESAGRPGGFDQEHLRFIGAFCDQIALALERDVLNRQSRAAEVEIESERMRNTLLNSVSHDLRTPLTVILGSASGLAEGGDSLPSATRKILVQTITEESSRMDRLVNNLLQMSRLESGTIRINPDWHVLGEVIGAALRRIENLLVDHPLTIQIPTDFPMLRFDAFLMEQVFINLVENAVKHTSKGTPIEIRASGRGSEAVIQVADRGPGLKLGAEEKIFDKFHQSDPTRNGRGVGLGLTICRSVIELHGGRIRAENRDGSGALFSFTLPLEDTSPRIEDVEGTPEAT